MFAIELYLEKLMNRNIFEKKGNKVKIIKLNLMTTT